MIELTTGNLLEADTEALVNTVNCVGIMGKGIALQFKQAYPENFAVYEKACRAGAVQPGRMLTVPTGALTNPKYIINFPTKRHWKGKSRIEDIQSGLPALIDEVRRLEVTSIAVPPLGCGSGGLDWSEVRPLIEAAFAALPHVRVLLYAPQGAPDAEAMPVRTKKPSMTRARALFVKLIELYSVPGYRLSLLEIQKLAYFLQWAGEPLRLHFVKQKYGPYAENLHFVLQRLEGHLIRGYGDRSRGAQIHLLPQAIVEADAFLAHDADAAARLERVRQLIEGFETPYGMELLASAHWVTTHETAPATTLEEAMVKIHTWNGRKKHLFTPAHIRIAWKRLHEEGWLQPVAE
jgi:O-acetyl-ADP-ribose deacetylase (regulator of RNase III)